MNKMILKRINRFVVLVFITILLLSNQTIVDALNYGIESCVDVTHSSLAGYGFGNYENECSRYQTFINGNYKFMESVDLKIRKAFGSDQTDVLVMLCEAENGRPKPYTVVARANIPASLVRYDWTVIKAPLKYDKLVPYKEYAILLSQDYRRSARYEWAVGHVDNRFGFGKGDYYSTTFTDESYVGDGWMKVWGHNYGNITEITHTRELGNGFGNNVDEVKRYQTFIVAGKQQSLTGVNFRLRKVFGTTQSDIKVELYKALNKKPYGSVLASSTIPASSIRDYWTWAYSDLSYMSLDFRGEYAIVLSQISPQPARYEWAVGHVSSDVSFGKFNNYSWTDESGLGDGYMKLSLTTDNTIIDQTSDDTPANSFGSHYDQIKRFQTFLVEGQNQESITGIDLKLRKVNGYSQSDVVVHLYDIKDRMPVGTPLASSTIDSAAIGSSWTEVHASLKYSGLVRGKEYAIVLSQDKPQAACYEWSKDFVNKGYRFGKWNGNSWIDESGIGSAWMRIYTGARSAMIDQSNNSVWGYGFGNTYNEVKRYQTFYYSSGTTRQINGVELKLRKAFGTGQSDVVVELYHMYNGLPSGSPLASATIPAACISTDWTIVNAPLVYRIIYPNTVYIIVLSQKTPQTARYEWATSQVSQTLDFGKSNGYVWTNESGLGDGWMRIWTGPVERAASSTHSSLTGCGFGNTYNEISRYQTFKVPYTYTHVKGIELKLKKIYGQNQGDVIVELYETDVNHMPSKKLAISVIPASQIKNDWTIVRADFEVSLSSARSYALVLSQRAPKTARYEWAVGYVNNLIQFGKWNGSAWVNESGAGDGWMKVWY